MGELLKEHVDGLKLQLPTVEFAATCHARFIMSSTDLFILSSSSRDAGICWLLLTVLGVW